MKIYLDDIRNPKTDGWTVVRTAEDAIRFLDTGEVTEMSLDHDLGEGLKTGYDVVLYLEYKVHTDPDFVLPEVNVHSANPVGVRKMEFALRIINKAYESLQSR